MLGVKTTLMRPVWLLTRSRGRQKKNNRHVSLVAMNLPWKKFQPKKKKKEEKKKAREGKREPTARQVSGRGKPDLLAALYPVSVSETGVGSLTNRTPGCTPKPHLKSSQWSGITNHNAALYSRADKEQHPGQGRLESQPRQADGTQRGLAPHLVVNELLCPQLAYFPGSPLMKSLFAARPLEMFEACGMSENICLKSPGTLR